MKRILLVLALLLLASSTVFAQTPLYNTPGGHFVPIAAAIGMAIASGLCGIGQGIATKGAAEGIARNPSAGAAIRLALILGLALIESLALYTFVIVLIKVG
jgi:F-type H+-transporting ATPase subunit c